MPRPHWLSRGKVSVAQGGYYLLTGLWPLLAIGLFLSVTGAPEEELWLVRTVAGLLIVAGLVLLLAGLRQRVTIDIRILGMGFALVLALIDVVHVVNGTIRPVFLVDAVIELALLAGWAVARRAPVPPPPPAPERERAV